MERYRYSSIATAHQCLRKFQLQWLLQEKPKGQEGTGLDLKFGTALHGGLESILLGEGLPGAMASFMAHYSPILSLPPDQLITSKFNAKQLNEMGEIFLSRFDRLHFKHFSHCKPEVKVAGDIGGHEFEGTIDAVGEFKAVPSIIDFKTSNYPYAKEKILINEQMPIYAYLAERCLGYKAEQLVYYVFIKNEQRIQVITVPLTKALLDGCIRNVIMMASDLKKRTEFPMNPNSCVMGTFKCNYFNTCHGDKK